MPCKVAIVGACSLSGREILKTLSDRSFPLSQIRLFETESSVGQRLLYNNEEILVEEISEHILREAKFHFVFFAAGSKVSKGFIAFAQEAGSKIIDISSHAYAHMDAPLVVPHISFDSKKDTSLFASPVCLSVHLSLILAPLAKLSKLERIVGSTYQAVSGAGFFGVEELERQVVEIEDGKEAKLHYFPKQIAFNVFPEVEHFAEGDRWSKEELLIEKEVSTILGLKDLDLSLTCVRVPVLRGHSVSMTIDFDKEVSLDDIYNAWEENGISVYRDDYPTAWDLEGTLDVGVGRLRKDKKRSNSIHFWTVADNLSVGMALNAVQIAEELL